MKGRGHGLEEIFRFRQMVNLALGSEHLGEDSVVRRHEGMGPAPGGDGFAMSADAGVDDDQMDGIFGNETFATTTELSVQLHLAFAVLEVQLEGDQVVSFFPGLCRSVW